MMDDKKDTEPRAAGFGEGRAGGRTTARDARISGNAGKERIAAEDRIFSILLEKINISRDMTSKMDVLIIQQR